MGPIMITPSLLNICMVERLKKDLTLALLTGLDEQN